MTVEQETVSIEDFIGQQFDEIEQSDNMGEALTGDKVGQEVDLTASEAVEGDVEAESDAEAVEASDEDADKEGDETEGTQTITAPQSMSAKDREAFYKLTPEQQTWLSERVKQQEADYTRKTMELADQRKTYDRLEQVLAPRRQQLAMDGMDESTAIGQLFALSDFANQNPVGFVSYLLQQRGIPLEALTQQGQQQQANPQLAAYQRELQGVKEFITRQEQQQIEQRVSQAESVWTDFVKNEANSFAAELEQEMIPIVHALRQSHPNLTQQQYLDKAYKMAIAANEEVSAKIDSDRKAKDEVARIAKAKADAAQARKGASTNVNSRGHIPASAAKAKTVDEFVGALWDERTNAA